MLPNIPLNIFENDLYTIVGTENNQASIAYLDYSISKGTNMIPGTVKPWFFTKLVNLKNTITINYNENQDQNIVNNNLFNYIKSELNKEFIRKVTDLCKKQREKDIEKYDIIIPDIKKYCLTRNLSISEKILQECYLISNKVGLNGRLGPSQWMLSNSETYLYVLSNLSDIESVFVSNNLKIGNMTYYVDDNVENDIIIFGRKNKIDNPGISCVIQTDSKKNILCHESYNSNIPYNYKIFFEFPEIGNAPELQYHCSLVRDIRYYRSKKLERIKFRYE